MDNDGVLDLVSRWGGLLNGDNRAELTVARGDGMGGFAAASSVPLNSVGGAHVAADFDQDGQPDIATFGPSARILILLSQCLAFCHDRSGDGEDPASSLNSASCSCASIFSKTPGADGPPRGFTP